MRFLPLCRAAAFLLTCSAWQQGWSHRDPEQPEGIGPRAEAPIATCSGREVVDREGRVARAFLETMPLAEVVEVGDDVPSARRAEVRDEALIALSALPKALQQELVTAELRIVVTRYPPTLCAERWAGGCLSLVRAKTRRKLFIDPWHVSFPTSMVTAIGRVFHRTLRGPSDDRAGWAETFEKFYCGRAAPAKDRSPHVRSFAADAYDLELRSRAPH